MVLVTEEDEDAENTEVSALVARFVNTAQAERKIKL